MLPANSAATLPPIHVHVNQAGGGYDPNMGRGQHDVEDNPVERVERPTSPDHHLTYQQILPQMKR